MIPAPLSFLRSPSPPRTNIASSRILLLEGTRDQNSIHQFFSPPLDGTWSIKQVHPPKNRRHDDSLSFMPPPPHYHLLQDETFKVQSGAGIWHLYNGRKVHVSAGEEITVPRRRWHRFENDPESDVPLVVLIRYEREYADMEDEFFQNIFGYIDDCWRAGVQPSGFQMMAIAMRFWMPFAIPVPGPEWLNLALSTTVMVVVGSIGTFLLGYRASHPEYYSPRRKGE